MPRNLDLTALRSFLTVAETGGVTRAAGQLNLTQSAVSMQLKRLEEALDAQLLDRTGRGVTLTSEGEQVAAYARRILSLNDEVWDRLTGASFEGELTFGVPHDIVYPHVPAVLRSFDREYPRVKVHLVSSYTKKLKELFARGEIDLILTTEKEVEQDGQVLEEAQMVWVGAVGGAAWRNRPLRLGFETGCLFRAPTIDALEKAGVPWEMAVDSESTRTIEASVSADLAVHVALESNIAPYAEPIRHGGALPDLPSMKICIYAARGPKAALVEPLADCVRAAWRGGGQLKAVDAA
jgi:DNA-binding transcriptional LysR family regulator